MEATTQAGHAGLAEVPWRVLAEELAERLGLDTGERRLELVFSHGVFRRLFLHHGPIGSEELSYLLERERPRVLGRPS